jgi:thiamine kinase-like enzyme
VLYALSCVVWLRVPHNMITSDMEHMNSQDLIAAVQEALPSRYTRNTLHMGLVRNNYSLSNDDYFIKIAGPGAKPGALHHELNTVLSIDDPDHTTTPASREVHSTKYGDATIWELRPGTTYTPEQATSETLRAAYESLRQIQSRGVRVNTSLERTRQTIAHRQSLPTWISMSPNLRRDLERLIAHCVYGLEISAQHLVFAHGDAHFGNIIFDRQRAIWCDFESAVMAPPEWDVASLRHNVLRIGGKVNAWESLHDDINHLDAHLIDTLEAMKAVAGTTYLIALGEYDLAAARTQSLLPLLSGKPFPERLVTHQGR